MSRSALHRSKYFYLMLAFGLILLPALAWAAGSPIAADARVDRNPITLGDVITYSITVRRDADIRVLPPNLTGFDGFDVLESPANAPREVEGQIENVFSVKLRADKVGSLSIASIPISFETQNGASSVPGEIRAPEVTVEVQSVLRAQGEPKDIRDIKDAVDVGRNWTPWIFAGLNLLLVLIAIYLFWKSRKAKHAVPVPKPLELAPHQIALRELDALKNKKLTEHGEFRLHFYELSEIFRRYLGRRFHFPASDWTTEEITARFLSLPELDSGARDETLRILRKSDLIKFAKAEAPPKNDEIEPVRKLIESIRERKVIGLYAE